MDKKLKRIYPVRDENSLPKKAKPKLLTPRNKSSQKVTRTIAQKTKGRRVQKQMLGVLDDGLKEYLGFATKKKKDYIDVPSKEVSKTVIAPKTNNTPSTSSNSKTNSPLLTSKSKIGIKSKLGLGALGLATTGAIGYGVYRKMRSDKGKKRGRYKN